MKFDCNSDGSSCSAEGGHKRYRIVDWSKFKGPGWRLRQEKGWVRRACEPPLHYRKIHQNYSQTSLKVSSFNLKILRYPPVVQGIPKRILKLSNADRKKKRRGKYCPILPYEPAMMAVSRTGAPHFFNCRRELMLSCRGSWYWCPSPFSNKDLVQP